jgi:hypothetical protein
MKRSVLFTVVAAAVLLGIPALAEDHQPPTVMLRVGERQQAGNTSSGIWTTPIDPPPGAPPGQYCGARIWDPAPYPFPKALRVPPGTVRALIEFQKAQAPEQLSINGWTVVTEDGQRRGPRSFAYSLRPLEEGAQVVAWVADFTFRAKKHLYLDVSAEWTDQEGMGCAGNRQYATWNFHVKNRRA